MFRRSHRANYDNHNTAVGESFTTHTYRHVEHNTARTEGQRQEAESGIVGVEEDEGRRAGVTGVRNRGEVGGGGGGGSGVGRREGGDWRTEVRRGEKGRRREERSGRKDEGGIRRNRSIPLTIRNHIEGSNTNVFKRLVVVSTSPGSGKSLSLSLSDPHSYIVL